MGNTAVEHCYFAEALLEAYPSASFWVPAEMETAFGMCSHPSTPWAVSAGHHCTGQGCS